MTEEIYRQGAVDNLLSAEELDQAPRVIQFRAWALIWTTLLAFVVAGGFSYFVEVPVSVSAEGIVLTPEGLREISLDTQGLVTELRLLPDQEVQIGDVVAVIDQTALREQLETLEVSLAEVDDYLQQLIQLDKLYQSAREEYESASSSLELATRKRYREKEERLSKRETDLSLLLSGGFIDEDEIDSVLEQLLQTRESLSSISQKQIMRRQEDAQQKVQSQKELLSVQRQAEETKNQIQEIKSQLLEHGEVLVPIHGRIVQIDLAPGDFVNLGSRLATIQPISTFQNLQALVYPIYIDGSKLKIGMPVELEISAYPKEKYGVITGRVSNISHLPVSTESMMRSLRNDLLVHRLAGENAPFEVIIEFDKDPLDPSGYGWSAKSDDARMIRDGMETNVKVIVRTKKLYELFSPKPF